MPTNRNLLLYALVLIAVAFVVSRIPGITIDLLSRDHNDGHPITLGTNVWLGFEPFFLAQKAGTLAESDARVLEFSSSTQVMRSFANGTIDAAALTLDEVLAMRQTGVDIVVVMILDSSNGGDAIVASPEIANMRALTGKRVAAESTALGALMLARGLETNGMRLDDVDIVSVEIDEQEMMIERGRVDAVVTFSPVLERLKARGMVELFSSREIPGEIIDVLAVTPHVLHHHQDKLMILAEGWFAALEQLEQNPAQSAEWMSDRRGVSPVEINQALQQLTFFDHPMNAAYLSAEQGQLRERIRALNALMIDVGILDSDLDASLLMSDAVISALTPPSVP
ncbi:MAG: ABC transporter substrate-binding protein [Pseudomonadota bacterium]